MINMEAAKVVQVRNAASLDHGGGGRVVRWAVEEMLRCDWIQELYFEGRAGRILLVD